jgi:UDP-GlcNAc:undecaprenyl-phosphate GlcNAc-1-phosphate transferase
MTAAGAAMFGVYLLVLALSAAIALGATLAAWLATTRCQATALFAVRGPHERPRWGGAVIFLSFACTPFVASMISADAAGFFRPRSGEFAGFLAAAMLIFLVGLFDDLRIATWQQKVAVEVAAAVAVYAAGYRMDRIGFPWGPEVDLRWAGFGVTVLWVLFFTNALNLIDGRDGLATGVGALAAVTLAAIGASAHHPAVALLLVALAGAQLAFLPFNLPPASLYIGDSGALLLGFVLGSLSVRATTGATSAVFIAVTAVALAYPLLDAALAAVRRVLDGRHPFLGDQDHIHHRLEEAGFGPRGILLVTWGLSGLFSAGALLLHYVDWFVSEALVLLAVAGLVTFVLTRLGYIASLWNSRAVVAVRMRVSLPDGASTASPSPTTAPADGDS